MVLDGLSNNQGKYIPPTTLETHTQLKTQSKKSAQRYLKEVEDSHLFEKVDPDEKREKKKRHALTLQHAKELLENEVDDHELELVLGEKEEEEIKLNYSIKFNKEKKVVEITNTSNKDIIETISPDELLNVLARAKSISGIFVDRKV